MTKLSVIIPAFNEEKRIGKTTANPKGLTKKMWKL